jgi:hypothetical protein
MSCRLLITTDGCKGSSDLFVLFATTWRRRSHRQNLPDVHAAAGHRDPCAVCNSTRRCSHIPGYLAPRVSQPPSKNLWSRTYACIHVGMPPVKRGQYSAHPSVDASDTDVDLWRLAWLFVTKWGIKRNPTRLAYERRWTCPSKRGAMAPLASSTTASVPKNRYLAPTMRRRLPD